MTCSFSVVAVTLTALALLAVPSQAVIVRPDLVVTRVDLTGKQYVVKGDMATLSFRDVTKNNVPQGVQSRAGPSVTGFQLVKPSGRVLGPERDVPALGAGQSDGGGASVRIPTTGLPIGAYGVRACADETEAVRESDEDNNCKTSSDHFFVIKETWAGTLSGVGVLPIYNIVERFNSSNAKFVFDSPINVAHGVFGYDFAGSVTYRSKGAITGCTYLGAGTRAFGPGEFISPDTIFFNYLGHRYGGAAGVDTFFYSVDVNCGGAHGTMPAPVTSLNFFYSKPRALPFGETEISGSQRTTSQSWTWDLH